DRTRVDDLADTGHEVLGGLGHGPADEDERGIHQAHTGGQDLAEVPAGLADGLDRMDVTGLDELDDIGRGRDGHARGAEASRDRPPRGHGLQAAAVAAGAGHLGGSRQRHMADIAGGTVRTAAQRASRDDSGTDARGDLDEDEVGRLRPGRRPFAQGHDVDVVVDEDGGVEGLPQGPGHVESIPARSEERRVGKRRTVAGVQAGALPISAAPCEPRGREPPEMIPAPMPVATLTKMRSVVSGQAVVRSPRAMMLTSLSTKTGESKDSLRAPGTSNRSQ